MLLVSMTEPSFKSPKMPSSSATKNETSSSISFNTKDAVTVSSSLPSPTESPMLTDTPRVSNFAVFFSCWAPVAFKTSNAVNESNPINYTL